MKLSRRALLKNSLALLPAAAFPRVAYGTAGLNSIGFPWAFPSPAAAGIPRIAVENFSKPFDAAYLSNGLIGIRPGPNPIARAQTCVSGFVFSHHPNLVEALSPAPYPLETDIRVKGASLLAHPELFNIHRQSLDMATGELLTEGTFAPGIGVTLQIEILQFASRSVPSLLCQEIKVISSQDVEIEFVSAIDHTGVPGNLFFTEAPGRTPIDLVTGFQSEGDLAKLGVAVLIASPEASLQKKSPSVSDSGVSRTFRVNAKSTRPFRIHTIAAMISGLYHPEPALEAIRLANWGGLLGFEKLRLDNRSAWNDLWKARVRVTGDSDSQRMLDAAHFYIHSSLHSSTLTGMPPFGLSQWDHYFGHSFWDTESWSLLPVTLAAPATGRALVDFRVRSLDYARRQAALYGFRGAQFPWEAAQTRGFETTPTFAGTGWGEQHCTPDVAIGTWEYQLATNDPDFLHSGAWPVLRAVAEWIESRGVFTDRGFEIRNIMGPDETVPNIHNNSYMNIASQMAVAAAIRCAEMMGLPAPTPWKKIRDHFYIPIDGDAHIILPYDNPPDSHSSGYSTAQLDFLLLHNPPVDIDLIRATHNFEQSLHPPRPDSNDPLNFSIAFAAAATAATSAFLGNTSRASQIFRQAWKQSWLEPYGMMREIPSQTFGCFLTDYGSLLQTAMIGFTGLRITEGAWNKYPAMLPDGWSRIEIDRIWVRGEPRRLVASHGAPAKLSE
jgi:trehalose/maltose hydrolase-like predicted phosphorylase